MVIQLPEWTDWRISGEGIAWEVQRLIKKGKRAGEWEATNWFNSLDAAIGFAYERSLRELGMGSTIDMIREVHVACEKTKSALVREVKKAIG